MSYASVEAEDRQIVGGLRCAERAGKVHGVQRSDGIAGERLPCPLDDRRADPKQSPV